MKELSINELISIKEKLESWVLHIVTECDLSHPFKEKIKVSSHCYHRFVRNPRIEVIVKIGEENVIGLLLYFTKVENASLTKVTKYMLEDLIRIYFDLGLTHTNYMKFLFEDREEDIRDIIALTKKQKIVYYNRSITH